MKPRLSIRSLFLTAAAGGTLIAGSAAYPAGAAPSPPDIHTTAKLTFSHSVDVGARGPSAGDISTFGGRLIGPDLKGRYQAYCVNVTRTSEQCSETVVTPEGQIAALAVYSTGGTAGRRYLRSHQSSAELAVTPGCEAR